MFRSALAALTLVVLPAVAEAQSATHRVERGETLWAIASRYYESPSKWREIYEANRGTVEDPHWIFPGEELVIPSLAAVATADPTSSLAAPAAEQSLVTPVAEVAAETPPAPAEPVIEDDLDQADRMAGEPAHPAEHDLRPVVSPAPTPAVAVTDSDRPEVHAEVVEAAPVTASMTTSASSPAEAYGVMPGDELETGFFTAAGEAVGSVQGSRVIDREGNVFFPFIGTVHVQGLNAGQIRGLLTERFTRFYRNPVVTVDVKLKVNITGVVGSPGHYLVEPTSTVMDALAKAGGAGLELTIANNAAADVQNVRLIRGGETILLDLRPETLDPSVHNLLVQSGDWIHVPPQARSRLRDDITFWSGVVALLTSAVAAIAILGG